MKSISIFFISALVMLMISRISSAQLADQDFTAEQLQFTFMSTDGSNWQSCTHNPKQAPHGWDVNCGPYKFSLHLFLRQYLRANESTFELNYWADEISILNETHTHSTWITVDQKAQAQKIVSYLGFSKDTSQLRFEAKLN